MTIGKKLYVNFGIILSMVVVLFIVNLLAVHREHDAKDAASASLKLADATNDVRFQMMQNRLYLSNYLLSGDSREVDRMNEGLHTLSDKLQEGAEAVELRTGALGFGPSATTGAVLEQRVCSASDRQTERRRLRECDCGRIADLLLTKRCFFVGEKFHRRPGRGRWRKPQTG